MVEYKVLWTDAAQTDLETIVDFIAEEDLRNARRVLERLEKRARALRRFPERGRVVSEMRTLDVFLYRELIERPWRMIYRFDDKRVYVLAVLDSRRELTSLLLERLARRGDSTSTYVLVHPCSIGKPAALHSGYPSSNRRALNPFFRSAATASNARTQ